MAAENKFILVTGGARSGKSTFALEMAESYATDRIFIATCPRIDSELDDRVDRHQQERQGRGWQTIEEEVDIAGLLKGPPDSTVYLIDCLTLWINNLQYREQLKGREITQDQIQIQVEELIQSVRSSPATVICVTNEVGMGIVPDNANARRYRDLVGTCNRVIAQQADKVVLVSCGLPLVLKDGGVTTYRQE